MKPNLQSRTIFLGDNLDFLRGINSACIDLVYADPPFNKKKQFTAPIGSAAEGASFLDLFGEEDVKDEWVAELRHENYELHAFLSGIKAVGNAYNYCYLVYMAIRFIECRRILKLTGSFYLHCDHTMAHYLKITLDCIFGEKNFRNEIIWGYAKPRPAKKMFVRNHDTVLFYARSADTKFNPQRMPTIKGAFEKRKPFKRPDGTVWEAKQEGVLAGSWWHDIPSFSTRMSAKERTGWPTQKPLKLMQRIIAASSNKGDWVLDPFCGCVTTCIAAELLERHWVGIDVAAESWAQIERRLNTEIPPDLLRGPAHKSTTPPKRGKSDTRPKKSVYVISNPAYPGIYKVGVAGNVKARLNSYQTADPRRGYRLEYHRQTAHYRDLEAHIHAKFNGDHEWVPGALADIIEAIKAYRPAQDDHLGF
ncbi:MAG: DNA methyltransferase [Gammaproteobacteria bacterium]|nr:DNA methyltransferase [Gammaproteobacteria bacterium]